MPDGNVYPVPGAGGLTDAQYREMSTVLGDEIVGDLGGSGASSFDITGRSSSSRDFAFRLGDLRIRGEYFEATGTSKTLTVPSIASGSTRIDRLVATLDASVTPPTLVVEILQGAATTGTPTVPALSRNPTGQWQVGLWLIQGGIGPAGSLTFTDQRIWVSPNYYTAAFANLSETALPNGSRLLEANTDCQWRVGYPGGVAQWINTDQPNWQSLAISGFTGHDGPTQYRLRRGQVEVQGGIAATSGNLPTGSTLCTLPAGARPAVSKRVPAATSAGVAQVEILTNGIIRLATTAAACTWVNLDGIAPFQQGN